MNTPNMTAMTLRQRRMAPPQPSATSPRIPALATRRPQLAAEPEENLQDLITAAQGLARKGARQARHEREDAIDGHGHRRRDDGAQLHRQILGLAGLAADDPDE